MRRMVVGGVALLLVLGCGGSDSGSLDLMCPALEQCGGEIAGRWRLQRTCLDPDENPLAESCPGIDFDVSAAVVSGELELREDGTFRRTLEVSGSVEVAFPGDCLGEGQSCQAFGDTEIGGDVDCEGAPDAGCSCISRATAPPLTESGDWRVIDDDILRLEPDVGFSSVLFFCVEGDTLRIAERQESELAGSIYVKD